MTFSSYLRSLIRFGISVPAELIISNRHVIWRYTVDGRAKGHVLNTNLTNAVAVDYDWLEQRVYWSDVTSTLSRIGRVFFNGTGFEVCTIQLASTSEANIMHTLGTACAHRAKS